MKRVAALDIGGKRIGIALSDPEKMIAFPKGFVEAEKALEEIPHLFRQWSVGAVVVGIPVTLRGEEGPQALKVKEFLSSLEDAFRKEGMEIEIVLWDERLSTAQAEAFLRQAGYKAGKMRRRVDAASATLILQSYLDFLRRA
ncbi:MAG: Holliday junction resolvase RuvX [Anaerolineae bacterium]|nr:Holliday junction resolvase RuvX [Anaerolineae bacterium]MDW8102691.1 Holliday junction resolvase RuvX [Anaerolineae bacterium]